MTFQSMRRFLMTLCVLMCPQVDATDICGWGGTQRADWSQLWGGGGGREKGGKGVGIKGEQKIKRETASSLKLDEKKEDSIRNSAPIFCM